MGSLCLPMLLVPVAYVCSQLLPVGSASFIVSQPAGACPARSTPRAATHSAGGCAQALVRVGMALLMGRWLLLVLTTPNFIPFPYTSSPTSEHAKPVVVIFAASFNPPHVGHLDILEYLSTTADKVTFRPGGVCNRMACALLTRTRGYTHPPTLCSACSAHSAQ